MLTCDQFSFSETTRFSLRYIDRHNRGIPISLEHNDIPIFWDSRCGVDFSLVPIRKNWVLSPAIAMTREFLNPIFLGRVQKFWFRPDSENLWSLEFDKLVLKFDEFVLKFDIIV